MENFGKFYNIFLLDLQLVVMLRKPYLSGRLRNRGDTQRGHPTWTSVLLQPNKFQVIFRTHIWRNWQIFWLFSITCKNISLHVASIELTKRPYLEGQTGLGITSWMISVNSIKVYGRQIQPFIYFILFNLFQLFFPRKFCKLLQKRLCELGMAKYRCDQSRALTLLLNTNPFPPGLDVWHRVPPEHQGPQAVPQLPCGQSIPALCQMRQGSK